VEKIPKERRETVFSYQDRDRLGHGW